MYVYNYDNNEYAMHNFTQKRRHGGTGGRVPPVFSRVDFVFCLTSSRKCWGRCNILATYLL